MMEVTYWKSGNQYCAYGFMPYTSLCGVGSQQDIFPVHMLIIQTEWDMA